MIRVVAAAIVADGRLLAALRGPGMTRPGWFELPGGKVEPGESDEAALVREIREELGCEVAVEAALGDSVDGPVHLFAYRCRLVAGRPRAIEHSEVRWVGRREAADLRWAPPDVPLVAALSQELEDDPDPR